jgi:hypothetical protein
MIYVFDIDNTICITKNGEYEKSAPMCDRIDKINQLYKEGHIIHFLTARGMGRSNNTDPGMFKELTSNQLDEWGVDYHRLFMGKPAGDLYIDDKAIKDEEFFRD